MLKESQDFFVATAGVVKLFSFTSQRRFTGAEGYIPDSFPFTCRRLLREGVHCTDRFLKMLLSLTNSRLVHCSLDLLLFFTRLEARLPE